MIDTFFWLLALVFFLFIESSTVALVSIWFAAGSVVALIASLLGAPVWLQVVVCLVVAGVLLASLRPFVRKYIKPRVIATNVDALIGRSGYVTAAIDNLNATGEVKLGAMIWSARSSTGEVIPEKTLVKVDAIEGVKVFVTPVKPEETV